MGGKRPPNPPGKTVLLMVLVLWAAAAAGYWAFRSLAVKSPDGAFVRADFPSEDLVFDPTAIPPAKGEQSPPLDLAAALKADDAALKRGEILYAQNCASCHGMSGRGDGPAGAGLQPLPRNFTGEAGWKNGPTVTGLFRTLALGIPGGSMAAYDYLPPEDRFALAHHVRTLTGFAPPPDTPQEVAALDREFGLSEGYRKPHRVPVALALERMGSEFAPAPPLVSPEGGGGSLEALFDKAVTDPARAAETLAGSDAWRSGLPSFVSLVTSGSPRNGFAPAAAALSEEEWEMLYGACLLQATRPAADTGQEA